MDDVRAIMDDIGSRRAVLLGFSEGCPMSILFAATYPERVSHLVLYGGFARAADLRPPGLTPDALKARFAERVRKWGNGDMMKIVAASQAQDKEAVALLAKFERLASSPGALKTILLLNRQIDVTSILPTVQVPTLVLNRKTDAVVPVVLGSRMAAQIPAPDISNIPAVTMRFGRGIPRVCSAMSRSSSPGSATTARPNWSAFLLPSCLRISSTRRAGLRKWETSAGVTFWIATITWRAR